MNTNAQKYASDFNAAKDLKESLLCALYDESCDSAQSQPEPPTTLQNVLPDARKVYLYFPHGREVMREALGKRKELFQHNCFPLYFVLFVGYKKEFDCGQDLVQSAWDLDTGLKKDMAAIDEILSYSSCERTVGGDWTNLVIFTSLEAVHKWRSSPLHTTAVRDLSPKYYSKIRIHRGQIHGDFRNGVFDLHRTLFLGYEKAPIVKRHEKYWNNADLSPVLVRC